MSKEHTNAEDTTSAIPQTVSSATEILREVLKDASQVIFLEGKVPHVQTKMKVHRLDIPEVTREDIENFVRASGNRQVNEKIDLISKKSREDYTRFGQQDIINYSIGAEFAYRGTYRMSSHGAELVIRRIPRHAPATEFRTSPGQALDAESTTSQPEER